MQAAKCLLQNVTPKLPAIQVRNKSFPRWWTFVRSSMNKQKKDLERNGPPPPKPRSVWINWNYRAELFAFGKRLHEEIPEATLQRAFIHKSYVEKEEIRREHLDVSKENLTFSLEDNSNLIKEGEEVMTTFIQKYIHQAYPSLPEEGKRTLQEYLMTEDMLSYVASQLGFADLILSEDFPATKTTLSLTFKAVIGAIKTNGSVPRAERFIQDFIISELIGKDVLELWNIPNPVAYLRNYLTQFEKEPETRLLREAGRNTIFAVYLVGIYVDRELLGYGPGETLSAAEEMASLDALKRIFGLKEFAPPLPFDPPPEIEKVVQRETIKIVPGL